MLCFAPRIAADAQVYHGLGPFTGSSKGTAGGHAWGGVVVIFRDFRGIGTEAMWWLELVSARTSLAMQR